MILVELDKAGAEWVIVANLSGDENMLDVVRSGKSPHTRTGSLISGASEELVEKEDDLVGVNTDPLLIEELRQSISELNTSNYFLPRSMSIRQAGKKSNHGLNYDMRYKRFALENEIQEKEAKTLVDLYHSAYPGIRVWHKTIQNQLRKDRTLVNCFGRKRKFLGAWGPDLFNAAYSFLPQSTTWDILRQGLIKTYNDTSILFRPVEILTEVHDSFDFQYPTRPDDLAQVVHKISTDYLNSLCVYGSRKFYINTTVKIGFSYGNMKPIKLSDDIDSISKEIQDTLSRLRDAETAQ